MKIAIIGTGWIAEKMAVTVSGMPEAEIVAVVSRTMERAVLFARKWNIRHTYDSLDKMLQNNQVELVYIATPHANHYEEARSCLLTGKPVLCEKAFTATAWQAEELLHISKEMKVYIGEAIWTRYMPLSKEIVRLVQSGVIGTPYLLSANLGYPLAYKERMQRPELAGGTLLDLGVYPINFASMIFGDDIKEIKSVCTKTASGMDEQESITLVYNDGKIAVLHASMVAKTDRQGIISGDKGHIIVKNINNPEQVVVVDSDYNPIAGYDAPKQITGYEYQVYASFEAISKGQTEPDDMPHSETLRIMQLMDSLRKEWGVVYPFDK